jgi:uncharacterized RmlC-like cupin family protein
VELEQQLSAQMSHQTVLIPYSMGEVGCPAMACAVGSRMHQHAVVLPGFPLWCPRGVTHNPVRIQLVSELHSSASILDEEYVEAGTLITVRTIQSMIF